MASTTFNGPVRSEKGFQVATKNTSTGAFTTRMSSGMPDLTGLTKNDLATSSTVEGDATAISASIPSNGPQSFSGVVLDPPYGRNSQGSLDH